MYKLSCLISEISDIKLFYTIDTVTFFSKRSVEASLSEFQVLVMKSVWCFQRRNARKFAVAAATSRAVIDRPALLGKLSIFR